MLRAALELLAPFAAAAVTAGALVALAPDRGLAWRASSAYPGHTAEGWSGRMQQNGVFFHTQKEDRPWVELTLPEPREVSRVVVRNRSDNLRRASPLELEVRDGDGPWKKVGRKGRPFREYTFTFPPTRATAIRLRVDKKQTYLHLESVDVE